MSDSIPHPALRYYGGKFRLGSWIASKFPPHVCYVEPFGGAAGVLLRKDPSEIEVFNDLDGRLVNFFRALRDHPRELIRLVRRTPYARAEFRLAFDRAEDPLEDARRFFCFAWQSFGGASMHRNTGWKLQRRSWLNSRANRLGEWRTAARNLIAVSRRFRSVQIESDDALRVISRFDTADTLFYCDPPYPASVRNKRWVDAYSHELRLEDHVHLANLLHRVRGKAIVSSYPNVLYESLYVGWRKLEKTSQTMSGTVALEVLWLSPNCGLSAPEAQPS